MGKRIVGFEICDIDELERLHAGLPVLRAETWNHEDGEGHAAIIAVFEPDCDDDEHPGAYDAAVAGVRIIDALPGLIAELKALRSLMAEFRDGYDCDEDAHTHGTQCRCCAATAALAKVPT